MAEQAKQSSTSSDEPRCHMPDCCREMAEKMGDCGPMMARFMERMKSSAASADEAKPERG